MSGDTAARGGRRLLAAALALLGLHVLLTVAVTPEAPFLRLPVALSPDLLLLAGAALLLPRAWLPPALWVRVLLATALLAAVAVRIAGLIAVELLGRPLDPAGDLPHLANVADMLGTVHPALAFAVLVPLVGLVGGGLAVLLALALGILAEAAARPPRRRRLVGGFALAALGLGAFLAASAPGPPGGSAFRAAWELAALAAAPPLPLPLSPALSGAPDLGDADLYVIFVESYGVAAFEDPGRRPRLEAAARRWEEDAAAGGFDFRSAQIQSPTFGGGSWRAHASLLSGVWLERETDYAALMRSDRVGLVELLGRAGYRTVAFEPGITGPWPVGDWYGFDRIYDRAAIGYEGPAMGWWQVPDQFTLHALNRLEIHRVSGPLFAKVSLITSHIPYWPVPPYVTPWTRFDDHTAFDGPLRSVAHDDAHDRAELSERYLTSLEYQFRILGGFLRDFAPRRALVAVIGDHQPPRLSLHDSDTWATPIHLFSRDPDLLAPWEARGFTRTLVPEAGTAWRMSDFPHDLAAFFPEQASRSATR